MKKYVYTTVTPDFVPCARVMLDSLERHAPDTEVIVDAVSFGETEIPVASTVSRCVCRIELMDAANCVCSYRVERMATLVEELGDGLLLMLDVDTYCQTNPFLMFDDYPYADILLTSRQYPCRYPINAGVQGYRLGGPSMEFLRHYAAQLHTRKTWLPFLDFQRRFGRERLDGRQWIEDQDYLCATYDYCVNRGKAHPSGVTVADAGPQYNWTIPYDDPKHRLYARYMMDMLDKVGNPEYKILHFKGNMKQAMPGIGAVKIQQRGKA